MVKSLLLISHLLELHHQLPRMYTRVDNEPHFMLMMAFLLPLLLPAALHVLSVDFPLSLSGAVGEVTLPTRQKDKNHLTQKPFGIFQPNSTFSSFPEESLFNVESLPVDMAGGWEKTAFHPEKTVS